MFIIDITSGKLHKIPHVRYSLEPICGSVAETGDLTKPFQNQTELKLRKSFYDLLFFQEKKNVL